MDLAVWGWCGVSVVGTDHSPSPLVPQVPLGARHDLVMELLVLYPPTKRVKGVEHHLYVQLMHLVAKGAHVILHKREKRGKESAGEESCLTTRHQKKEQQKANK